MPIRDAFILCGGFGSRLGVLTDSTPKPMLIVDQLPFIEHVILSLCNTGITKVFLLAGYLGEQIFSKYHEKLIGNIYVEVIIEKEPLGTGGAIYAALDQASEEFLLLNGDTWTTQNINDFEKKYFALKNSRVNVECLALCIEVDDAGRYGKLIVDKNNTITTFDDNSISDESTINGGLYIVNKNAFSNVYGMKYFGFEKEILPSLISRNSLYGYCPEQKVSFIDVGIPSDYNKAETFLRSASLKPAVFWDRDNTLINDAGYTHKVEDLSWLKGAQKSIAHLHKLGFWNFVITNQSGIARGMYSECDVVKFHREMQNQLLLAGCSIDFYNFCPHHADGSVVDYTQNCNCRKPSTGLVDQLSEKFSIDFANSFVVGDKYSDIELAQNLGIGHVLVDPSLDIFEQVTSYLRRNN